MHNNDNDLPDTLSKPSGAQLPGFDSENAGNKAPREQRREPFFSGFEEEDDYEESDRDTDYASSYHEESLEDDEFDESPQDGDDFTPQAEIEWDSPEPDDSREEPDLEPGPKADTEPEQTSIHYTLSSEEDEEQEEDEWDDEEDAVDFQQWPLGLIVVAIVALLLLAAGGYGVIQQRSATQEEIRQLQAALATAARPADVTASRNAMREVQERNTELLTSVDALTLENRRLADTVAGLESQLEAQQAAVAKQAATPKPVAAPAPIKPATPQSATPRPATPKPSAPIAVDAWFVNFSSYDQRTTAEGWASRLKPGAGKVVVTTGNKGGGDCLPGTRDRIIQPGIRRENCPATGK